MICDALYILHLPIGVKKKKIIIIKFFHRDIDEMSSHQISVTLCQVVSSYFLLLTNFSMHAIGRSVPSDI